MKSKDQQLLEEAYRLIAEGQSLELYHAADKKDLESFKNGIRIDLAGTKHHGAGKEQGAGFYVFKNKKDALSQAANMNEGEQIIVVIDRNGLNPSEFDIDYEAGGYFVLVFIKHLLDNKLINPADYNIKVFSSGGISVNGKGFGLLANITKEPKDPTQGAALASFCRQLQQTKPELFSKFENEYLNRSSALKYNGEELIYPVRIEDVQGNILWSKQINK
jgi:hypothetical protein